MIREKRKNVHAGIVGTISAAAGISWRIDRALPFIGLMSGGQQIVREAAISYNPYRHGHFFLRSDSDVTVQGAGWVQLLGRSVYAYSRQDIPRTVADQLPLFPQ